MFDALLGLNTTCYENEKCNSLKKLKITKFPYPNSGHWTLGTELLIFFHYNLVEKVKNKVNKEKYVVLNKFYEEG